MAGQGSGMEKVPQAVLSLSRLILSFCAEYHHFAYPDSTRRIGNEKTLVFDIGIDKEHAKRTSSLGPPTALGGVRLEIEPQLYMEGLGYRSTRRDVT